MTLKFQSHQAYDHILESWEDRRLIALLIAEVVGGRGWSWVVVGDRG